MDNRSEEKMANEMSAALAAFNLLELNTPPEDVRYRLIQSGVNPENAAHIISRSIEILNDRQRR